MSSTDYRLPTNVTPSHYDLTIRTDLHAFKFYGAVEIDLKVNEETSQIVLNALDLSIGDVSIATADDQVLIPTTQALDKEKERATFQFPVKIPAGSTAKLHIKFEADLTQNLAGYYRSSWKDRDGKVSYYALTQFEVSPTFIYPSASTQKHSCSQPQPDARFHAGMNLR